MKQLKCQSDSRLVIRQINSEDQGKEPQLQKYYHIAKNLMRQFDQISVTHVSRAINDPLDVLS